MGTIMGVMDRNALYVTVSKGGGGPIKQGSWRAQMSNLDRRSADGRTGEGVPRSQVTALLPTSSHRAFEFCPV